MFIISDTILRYGVQVESSNRCLVCEPLHMNRGYRACSSRYSHISRFRIGPHLLLLHSLTSNFNDGNSRRAGGVLIAKIGPKKIALIGLLVTLLAQVLRSISSSTLQFTLFTALYGVGMAVVFPNLPKIAESSFPKEQQGLAAGIYMSGLPSGAIMGLVASSLLIPRISRSAILQLYALFLVIGAILWLLTAKDMPEGKVSMQEQLKEFLGSSAPFLIALISVALIFGLLLLPTFSLRIGEKKRSSCIRFSWLSFFPHSHGRDIRCDTSLLPLLYCRCSALLPLPRQ